MNLKIVLVIIFFGAVAFWLSNIIDLSPEEEKIIKEVDTVSIACWNLQVFGMEKSSNETLLNYYADKLNDYDIAIVQEVRDTSGIAIVKLAEKLPDYNYVFSARAGKSNSKEQYILFFNDKVTLTDFHDYQSEYQNLMERPPYKVTFVSNNWTFNVYTTHLDPDNVSAEFSVLQDIIPDNGDNIILGDFNADGDYYDEDNIQIFVNGYEWVIGNDVDTTVSPTSNTYDRIIISDGVENNFIDCGTMNDVDPEQSDHYLIYGVFSNEVN